jgi:hypothetical protein
MMDENRYEIAPVEHIRNLLNSVKDGKLTITYYDPIEPSYTVTYDVCCTAADAEGLVFKYETLTQALEAIGKIHSKLDTGVKVEDVLTAEQIAVWNTYICDFDEAFDAGKYDLNEIYDMRQCGAELNDEERDVLERHYEWFEAQCLKRLPKKMHSPMHFVNKAQRYERLIALKAPKIVINAEGCALAEEMVLYYFAKE